MCIVTRELNLPRALKTLVLVNFLGRCFLKLTLSSSKSCFRIPYSIESPPAPRLNSSLPFTQERGCLDLVWEAYLLVFFPASCIKRSKDEHCDSSSV